MKITPEFEGRGFGFKIESRSKFQRGVIEKLFCLTNANLAGPNAKVIGSVGERQKKTRSQRNENDCLGLRLASGT